MSANQSKRPKRAAKSAAQGARAAAKTASAKPLDVAVTHGKELADRAQRVLEVLRGVHRLMKQDDGFEEGKALREEVLEPARTFLAQAIGDAVQLESAACRVSFSIVYHKLGEALRGAGGQRLADAFDAVQNLNPPTLAGALELIERYTTTRGPEHKAEMVATARRIQQASVKAVAS